jgi:hypothetical protein
VTVTVDGVGVPVSGSTNPDGSYVIENLVLTNPGFNPLDPNDPNNDWKITINTSMDPDRRSSMRWP